MTSHEGDDNLIMAQNESIRHTIEDNIVLLNEHPNYDPVTSLFLKHVPDCQPRTDKIAQIYEHNVRIVEKSRLRAQRINQALAMVSALDVLNGDIPIQGQFFGTESDDQAY